MVEIFGNGNCTRARTRIGSPLGTGCCLVESSKKKAGLGDRTNIFHFVRPVRSTGIAIWYLLVMSRFFLSFGVPRQTTVVPLCMAIGALVAETFLSRCRCLNDYTSRHYEAPREMTVTIVTTMFTFRASICCTKDKRRWSS